MTRFILSKSPNHFSKTCPACGGRGDVPDYFAMVQACRKARQEQKLSVRRIATHMCLSAAFVSDCELGRRNMGQAGIDKYIRAVNALAKNGGEK